MNKDVEHSQTFKNSLSFQTGLHSISIRLFSCYSFFEPFKNIHFIESILINSSHWGNFQLRILFLMDKIIQICHNELYVVTFANCLPSTYSVEISLFPAIFNLPVLHLSVFSSFSFLFFSLLPHSFFFHIVEGYGNIQHIAAENSDVNPLMD